MAMLITLCLFTGCTAGETGQQSPSIQSSSSTQDESSSAGQSMTFTDAMGYEVTVASWDRVVSLYGSFGETWVLAGGKLTGTTNDAIKERHLELGDDVAIVGTVQQPNLEEILALNPDFLILSADTAEHVDLHQALKPKSHMLTTAWMNSPSI